MNRDSAPALPYVVGLTGGIGSGKSTITRMFADLGAQVIDADVISRELLEPGSEACAEVLARFGPGLFEDETLDRSKLRALVFEDRQARIWLEKLLHPRIRTRIREEISRSRNSWLLLSAPLLLENDAYDFVDSVLVVDSPESAQIARTIDRDGVSREQVHAIMAAQLPREERLQKADRIIYNDADLAHLQRQVAGLYQYYEECGRERREAG